MTLYVVTGRTMISPQRFQYPWNVVTDTTNVGDTLDLTLSTDDEATLIGAGILVPQSSTLHHTVLG